MRSNEFKIFEAISQPVFLFDGQKVPYANGKMLRLLGFSLEEISLAQSLDFFVENDRGLAYKYLRDCYENDYASPSIELSICSSSGLVRNMEITGIKHVLTSDPVVVVTCQDLSDIKIVQDSLMEMGQRLNQIIENDPVATLVMNSNQVVTHWNAAAELLTGISKGAMIGSKDAWRPFYQNERPILANLIIRDAVDKEMTSLYKDISKKSSLISHAVEAEDFFPNIGKNGSWLYFTAAALRDSKGALVGAIETLQDVTARKDAEDSLRRQQLVLEWTVAERTAEVRSQHRQIEALLENAPIGIVRINKEEIMQANETFVEMFELRNIFMEKMHIEKIFSSQEDYLLVQKISKPRLKSGSSFNYEARMKTGLGNLRWIQLIGYPANPTEEDESSWWLFLDRTDIKDAHENLQDNFNRIKSINTKLEEAQNQLLQSEKMASIGQLAAGVAHEINNPLGFVSSNIGALGRYSSALLELGRVAQSAIGEPAGCIDQKLATSLRHILEKMDFEFVIEDLPNLLTETEEGLGRVKRIVQDLKDFSRVDHDEWAEADLNQGLDSTLNVVRNEVKYKAEVIKKYGSLPRVECLAAQINQVFMNIIVNAAQAIQEKGIITLQTEVEEECVVITISDNGCGMPEEVRKRIFEPFFTTKPVGKGTGLGLSLSYSIIKKHGGEIEVDSTPGSGTRFKITLPIRRPFREIGT